MLQKTIIIGAGLMGSSIARGLKAAYLSQQLVFIEKAADQRALIQDAGFSIGNFADVAEADCVILALPVLSIPQVLREIYPYLASQTLIMDVASTKAKLVREAQPILAEHFSHFVPAHPIAGKEQSGFAAGEATLFQNRAVILTPNKDTNLAAVENAQNFWLALGAKVYKMEAEAHDLAFAKYSHLSNILSFLLHNQARFAPFLAAELLPPSFIEMTRLAQSNPEMWRDICLSNQAAILPALEQFEKDLQVFKARLIQQDSDALLQFFSEGLDA